MESRDKGTLQEGRVKSIAGHTRKIYNQNKDTLPDWRDQRKMISRKDILVKL